MTERSTKMLPMSPRTAQQFEEIRETRRKEILDTAMEQFANEGFDKTSISKISQKAGISKGLLYNYFSGKEDLIKTIIFNGLDSLTSFIDPNQDGVITKDELKNFIEAFFNAVQRNEHYWRLYFSLFFQPHVLKLVEKRLIVMIHAYMNMLQNYFEAKGSDDPETDAIMLGAILDGIGFHFMANTAAIFPVEKIKKKLINTYC